MLFVGVISVSSGLTLAEKGRTDYSIIYDDTVEDVLLTPAVRDLSRFLGEMTGAEFPIRRSSDGANIYIGRTAPGDERPMQPRERRIRNVGRDIYFYGDARYGTAGAIYNFLRDCGCRWYTATGDMRIPKIDTLSFKALDYSHTPSFKSIEFGSKWSLVAQNPDIRDWIRRNNAFLMPEYTHGEAEDAWTYIGPVTHTLFAYIPPIKRPPRTFNADKEFLAGPHPIFADKEYFKTNPELFSKNKNGERVSGMQVCFSNPELRSLLLDNVQAVIEAENYNPDNYAILDFTQNDRQGGFCHCDNCKKLNEQFASPGGAYFDFLVEMGRLFQEKYPRLSFRFFSYKEDMTGIPPKDIRFPDNMSVIIAPLEQDFSKPYTHEYNARFLNQMKTWGSLCKEVWLWNYPVLYPFGMKIYSLFPGVYRNTENLREAYGLGVRYVIAEQGGSVVDSCSFKELNTYLQCLQAEDIGVDVDAAIREFCEACYGAAADDMMRYLKEADSACKKDPGYFRYFNDPRVMKVLHSAQNLIRWQESFDAMEAKVQDNPRSLFNVRRARLNLDAVSILVYPDLARQDSVFASGNSLEGIYARYCSYMRNDVAEMFKHMDNPKGAESYLDGFISQGPRMPYEFHRRQQSFPEDLLEKYGKDNLFSVMPAQSRRAPEVWGKPEESFGFAVKVPYTKNKLGLRQVYVGLKDGLPWNVDKNDPFDNPVLSPDNMPAVKAAGGFAVYYLGRKSLTPSANIRIATLPERDARFFLGSFYDDKNPKQEFDFFISMKDNGDGKSLLVDRIIIAK